MRRILVLVVALAAVVGGVLGFGSTPTSARPQTRVVKEEKLAGGAVKREWSNGTTFVGDANAVVTFSEDAAGQATSASVAVPGVSSTAAAARRARVYRRAGRSPGKDLRALEVPSPTTSRDAAVPKRPGARRLVDLHGRNYGTANSIYDSGCLELNRSDAIWRGCFTRKGTASSDCCAYYLADSSQASGHAKSGGHWLMYGHTEQRYAGGNSIVEWSPGSDINSSTCTATSIGISGYGALLSRSYTRCPKQIHIDVTATRFTAAWVGCKGSATTPGVAEAAFTRVPVGQSTTLYYGISYATRPFSC
jgi:hypothetical protein